MADLFNDGFSFEGENAFELEDLALPKDMVFNMIDFDFDGQKQVDRFTEQRYLPPRKSGLKRQNFKCVYENADELARSFVLKKDERHEFVVMGNFIFGDFIEAMFDVNDWKAHSLSISTLSFSKDNVDSLHNLIGWGMVDNLDFIFSYATYAMERAKDGLLPYLYQTLDGYENCKLQVAVFRIHTKVTLIHTKCDKYIVISGSANLRSSDSLEEFIIEENKERYDFYKQLHDNICEDYGTINQKMQTKGFKKSEVWNTLKKHKNQNKPKPEII